MKPNLVRVDGTRFVRSGKEVFFAGIGLGSWLNLEHFMVGLPGTDSMMRQAFAHVYGQEGANTFFERLADRFVTEADFAFLREIGVNLVRVPFNYRLLMDDQRPGVYRERGFQVFDRLFDLAERYGVYVLPDLHATPGGQNPDWHCDNPTGYTQFWDFALFREQMVELWAAFAARYRDREYLLGYDLLNEPFVVPGLLSAEGGDGLRGDYAAGYANELLNDFYADCTAAIRAVDPDHILFLEGDRFAAGFDCLHDLSDPQTALTFHYYPTVWFPGLYTDAYGPEERAEKFDEVMARLVSIRERFGRPALCGEAGYEITLNGFDRTLPLIRLTMELFKKYHVPFTLWSYKDAKFMGMVSPKDDSPWMALTRKIGERWSHHGALDDAAALVDELCEKRFPEATASERYVLTFRQRAILYPLEEKYVLEPLLRELEFERALALPDSFLLENCDVYRDFAALYRMFEAETGRSAR